MKKIIISLILGLTCVIISQAQVGIRGGLNYSNFSVSDVDGNIGINPKPGFHFGLTYDISAGTSLTFRPGVLYSSKGAKIDAFGETLTTKFDYIEIPLNLLYKFEQEDGGFFLQGGPAIGFLMIAEQGGQDLKDEVTSTDIGFTLGLGYMVDSQISFGVDYTNGFSNLAMDSEETIKNTNFSVYVHYKI